MIEKNKETLSQRFDRFEKINFPLQAKVIASATNALNSLKKYLASDKNKKEHDEAKQSLDQWKQAIDAYKSDSK